MKHNTELFPDSYLIEIASGIRHSHESDKEQVELLRRFEKSVLQKVNAELASGPAVTGFLKDAPSLMAELTRLLIENKDVRSRERLKQRIKSVLDFIVTDTFFPPGVDKEESDTAQEFVR